MLKLDFKIVDWLLEGDVAIQYLVHKDLLSSDKATLSELQARIPLEGFGKAYLDNRLDNGHWGSRYYYPKWTNSHYSILDMKNLGMPRIEPIIKSLNMILDEVKGEDGGINPSVTIPESDACLTGMVLNFASYFGIEETKLESLVDYILSEQLTDGGFNCERLRYGATHSSVHTTTSVLEGILEYKGNGYQYRLDELECAAKDAVEFMLIHHLYKSHHTGEKMFNNIDKFSYPWRWKYDVLRGLEYFADAEMPYDERLNDALDMLIKKRRKDGTWTVQNKHAGQVHFDMEKTGKPSRFNTYRALKVLKIYGNYMSDTTV